MSTYPYFRSSNLSILLSLFVRVGITNTIKEQSLAQLRNVLSSARRCRPYRSIFELGQEDFKLQLYLVGTTVSVAENHFLFIESLIITYTIGFNRLVVSSSAIQTL